MTATRAPLMPDRRHNRPRAKSIAARWFGLQIGTNVTMVSVAVYPDAVFEIPPVGGHYDADTWFQDRLTAWVL